MRRLSPIKTTVTAGCHFNASKKNFPPASLNSIYESRAFHTALHNILSLCSVTLVKKNRDITQLSQIRPPFKKMCQIFNQRQPGQPGDSVAIVAVKKLPCEACGKIFSRGDKLRLHFRATHTTEEAPFSCSFCNKKFFRSDHWKKHEQRHVKRGQVRPTERGR